MKVDYTSFKDLLELFKKKNGLNNDKFSLYKYSGAFLKFLANNKNFDSSLSQMSVTDIIKQNIAEQLNNSENQETGKNFLTDFIVQLFKDSDFIKNADLDEDAKISEDEVNNFLNNIDFDGNSNIALDELFSSIDKLKDGTLSLKASAPTEETPDVPTTGGGGGGGDYSPTNVNNDNNNDNTPKTLDNMTLDELNTEKESRNKTLTEAQSGLEAVYNGTNENIKTAQTNYDSAKEAYDEAVKNDDKISADLKSKREENLKNIDAKNTEIYATKQSITKKESEIFNQKATVAEDDATIKGLEAALGNLSQKEDDSEREKERQDMKASVEAQLKDAKAKKEKDEKDLKTMEDELTNLKTQQETQESELKVLEEERSTIETEISANCGEETADALKAFNEAKTSLDSVKTTEETNAKEALSKAQESVNEVNTHINTKTTEKVTKDNSLKGKTFGENVQYDKQFITDSSGMQYMVIAPKDVDPNEELPMLMYLHGSGEVGGGENGLLRSALPKTMLSGQNSGEFNFPENFRGYVVCPVLSSGNWCNNNAENCLRSIVNNFTSTHKVDKQNIAVAGHSLGGMGTIYMAKHMKDIFSRAAVISGYNTRDKEGSIDISSIDIPIMGYVGTASGDSGAWNYMKGRFKNLVQVNSGHGWAPGHALQLDKDKNGTPDFFEWLFPA